MKASELKVGQDFKFVGQRKFRCITEIKEIKPSDRALQEHIGKLLFFFDDDTQLLFAKDDDVNIEKVDTPLKKNLKKVLNRYEFEAFLNENYDESIYNETALQHFLYLTIPHPNLEHTISLEKLNLALQTKQFGWLLRKYDPTRFTAEYETARLK